MLKDQLLCTGKRGLSLALALIVCSALPAYALERPDAGVIMDSVKEHKNIVPPQTNVKIEVTQEQKKAPPQAAGIKFKVNGFHITGQTAYSEDKLQDLVKDSIGQELNLDELQITAARIAQYFNDRGYMVANAYIPAQKIKNGIVEITVVPGQYGSIDLRNHSKLSPNAANRLLSQIKIGDYVKKDVLERTLLLISDIGGISINATLAPGKTTGTTDLIVEINDTNLLTSEFSMDNYGNRYTGEDRGNISLNFNNISGAGDMANLSGNKSSDGMNNFNFSYLMQAGNRGARVGVGYSQLHYSLGREFEDLNASGTSKSSTIYGEYPLIRSRNRNLYARIGFEHSKLEDRIDYFNNAFTSKHTNTLTFGLNGDSQDKFHGGGINNFALTVATGRLGIDGGRDAYGNSAQTDDKEGLNTAGSYTKGNFDFNRLQYINDRLNFYLGFSGQLASKNLDSSEKFYLGGANGVRAYPQGEASGDQGYLLTGELRWNLPTPSYQLAVFVDNGRVTINKSPIPGAGDNNRTLTGAGVGLLISPRKDYDIRVDYAWRLGSARATSDTDKSGRLWLKGTRYF